MVDYNNLFFNCGIDSMGFYAPKYYIDVEDLAKARNVDPNKYKIGLMVHELRFPAFDEDIVSLGLKASYNALVKGNIDPKTIDAVLVGTETITYAVKSVSNIFAQLLEVQTNCFTQDVYNACAGGTLALINAISLIENGIIERALVVCVDIASYQLGSPGEPTQGSGAAAFIISKNPRILSFSKKFGKISGNINDFFRLPDEKFARVFGHYSVNAYLKFQLEIYDDLKRNIGDFKADYFVFHAPFPKLPLKAMQELLRKRWVNDLKEGLHKKEGFLEMFDKKESFMLDLKGIPSEVYLELIEEGLSAELFEEHSNYLFTTLKRMMLPQLLVPMHFGNMYCAAIWSQIIYIVENSGHVGDIIYFGSYGSGATAISGLLKVQNGFKQIVEQGSDINKYLHLKERKSIAEYELIKKGIYSSSKEIILGKIQISHINKNRGFKIHFCDEGCIIPNLEGVNHCPKGHSGFHERYFPLYAKLISDAITIPLDNNQNYLLNGFVKLDYYAKKGDLVEYEIRRVLNPEKAFSNNKHLLNWIPVYTASKILSWNT